MKKLIYILILISLTNCKAQKTTIMEEQIIIPKITKDFEAFDTEKFQNSNQSIYEEIKENIKIVYTGDMKDSPIKHGFSKVEYPLESYFKKINNYFKNGNIEIKGVSFKNGSEYGIWYEFDQNGKLIKEINMDFGYEFGWLAIIKYCQKNDIVLEKGYPKRGGIKTEIYKNEEDGKKVWTISYYDYKKEQYLEVTLDGTTGKELKRRTLELIGG